MNKYLLNIPEDQLKFGYGFGVRTYYNSFHLGLDILLPVGTPLFAAFAGRVDKAYGPEGGYQLYYYPDGMNVVIRVMHLSKYEKLGRVQPGDLIARTGISGRLVRGAHEHIDIYNLSKGPFSIYKKQNFINPKTWEGWNQ